MKLKAPFPYFGGKATVVNDVWGYLGNPKHYIEPFFGSGAVLLARPHSGLETVNDKDGFICNVWRSLQFAPDEVAKYCDWPVNHADLSARKMTMIKNEDRLLENLIKDEKWCDPVIAGYWIWAASCWIGSGLTCIGQIPHLTGGGMGVHAIGQRPHVADGGKGVHAIGQIPHLTGGGKGVQEPYNTNIYKWFRELSERLRHVRVVCGDWERVCGGNWQDKMGNVGIFFDPPYSAEAGRNNNLYRHESTTVAHDVRKWCLERGKNPNYRIVLAGYYDEHKELEDHGWLIKKWSAGGGYQNIANNDSKASNRHKETLFISPHCVVNQEILL